MAHDARSLANEIIKRTLADGGEITHLKVQKLVYYCEAWMLAIHGRSIIRQDVQAWQYGPVIDDLYYSLRHHKKAPITELIARASNVELDNDESDIVSRVYTQYGAKSAYNLSAMSHLKDSPWDITRRKWGNISSIPKSLIRDYYGKLWKEYQENHGQQSP